VKRYVFSIDASGRTSVGVYGAGVPYPLKPYPGLPAGLHRHWLWGVDSPRCYALACSVLLDLYTDDMVVGCLGLLFCKGIVERLPLKSCGLNDEAIFDWCEGTAGVLCDRVMTIDLSMPPEDK